MSLVEEAVCRLLMDSAGVAAIVGQRIYPVQLPQQPTYPAIVYTTIYSEHVQAQAGGSGLGGARISFGCYAATYGAAKNLAEAVRMAIQGYRGTVLGVWLQGVVSRGDQDLYHDDVNVYEIASDYYIWHSEALTV